MGKAISARILVVEDDPAVAAALAIRLQHAGYDVTSASDGQQGLETAIALKPDLIISDVWMPGAVGFLVAERLKAFDLGSIPLIFISGNKKKHLTELANEVGAVAFFEKPYDSEELLKTVAETLRTRHQSKEDNVGNKVITEQRPKRLRRSRVITKVSRRLRRATQTKL